MKKQNNTPSTQKNNSNSSYDWFRGNGGNNKQLSPKEQVKKVLKVLKIIMYILLASLSLAGCIQSFIIKTPGIVGRGMELYSSREDVAPYIKTLVVSKDGSITQDNTKRYWLNRNESNTAIKKAKINALDAIHKQIGDGFYKWKTENNGVRLEDEFGHGFDNFDSLQKFQQDKENKKPSKIDPTATIYKLNGPKNIFAVVGEHSKNKAIASYSTHDVVLPFYFPSSINIKKNKDYSWKKADVVISSERPSNKNDKAWILKQLIFERYIWYYKNSSLYKQAEISYNSLKAVSTVQPANYLSDIVKINNYRKNVANLIQIFGLGKMNYVETNKTDAKTAIKSNPTAKLLNELDDLRNNKISSPLFLFNLPSTNKQRAIYNWSKAWNLGPFYGLFVYPLSKLTLGISNGLPSESSWHGWETIVILFLTVFIVRTLAYGLTFKSTLQQVKQQELSAKRAAIEAKYLQYKGNKQMEQRKRQEMAAMFKKEGVSPLGSIGSVFLTMPIFLSMWKIIGGLAQFKSTNWLGINFSQTSWSQLIYNRGWQYLPLMLVAGIVQGISILLPRILTKRRDKNRINAQQKEALKKANKTQNIMAIVFIVFAIIMSAGIQIYWIFGGIYTIGQNFLNHHIIKYQSKKRKSKKIKA
ncbi:MAG: membrane protein insertase YidC [Mycoplasma sp.]|nr:membrane protein insertase YidC [Mycoplasma sp.]